MAISRADLVPDQSADSEARVTELRMRYRSLTARERQVMAGVIAGRLNKQIAYTLRIAERTTKAHRSRVMHKMAVRSVAELLRIHSDLAARGEPLDAWREP